MALELPAFHNHHVHFFERKWAGAAAIPDDELHAQIDETFTRYGFTSVFDIGSPLENTKAIRDRVSLRIRTTGPGFVPPGAMPPDVVTNLMGVMKIDAPEVRDAASAADAASALLENGADGIKLFASSPRSAPLTGETIAAAVDVAHRAGKPVFVHPHSGADVVTALRAGVDVIAHTTPHSGPWSDEIASLLKERGVALTPTLSLWRFFSRHDRKSAQENIMETAMAQLRLWRDSGGTILFGTDLGAVDPDPTEEYVWMARAGMSSREILASLTIPGDDRVILDGDPADDIRALAAVQTVIRDGRVVYSCLKP